MWGAECGACGGAQLPAARPEGRRGPTGPSCGAVSRVTRADRQAITSQEITEHVEVAYREARKDRHTIPEKTTTEPSQKRLTLGPRLALPAGPLTRSPSLMRSSAVLEALLSLNCRLSFVGPGALVSWGAAATLEWRDACSVPALASPCYQPWLVRVRGATSGEQGWECICVLSHPYRRVQAPSDSDSSRRTASARPAPRTPASDPAEPEVT